VDLVTSPADTWAYAGRARALTAVAEIEVRGGEHTMLRRAALWHSLAAAFTGVALGLPPPGAPVGPALASARRTLL